MLEITAPIQVGLQLVVPVLIAVLLVRRYGTAEVDSLRIILGGALSYAVAQGILLAGSQIISGLGLPAVPSGWESTVGAVAFGLAVGILEELARFVVLRVWLRDARSWAHGLMLGVGHGGAESIISGILGFIWFTTMQSLRAGPPPGQEVTEAEKASLDKLVSSYWSTPWEAPLIAGLQQVLMVVLALGLATLVMRVFLTGKPIYLLTAIGLHALAVGSLGFLGMYGLGYSTAAAVIFAAIGLLIVRIYAPARQPVAAPAPAVVGGVAPAKADRQRKTAKRTGRKR